MNKPTSNRGGALLAVLWLTAALSAIAFSLANTVRAETERVATSSDGVRAYYLASGSIDRALAYMSWLGHANIDGSPKYWTPSMPGFRFSYPSGEVLVELIPEASKININTASKEDLYRLMLAVGTEPPRAELLTAAIIDWRTPVGPQQVSPFDQFYLSRPQSFRSPHASFEEIEQLALVQGMTQELFHGSWRRTPEGNYFPLPGLKECLSVYSQGGQFDANSVSTAILKFINLPDDLITIFVQRRSQMPFKDMKQVTELLQGHPAAGRLRIGGENTWTVRATATTRAASGQLTDVRRSVAAVVKFPLNPTTPIPYTVVRWYDNAGTR